MLPDFPQIKQVIATEFQEYLESSIRVGDPVLSQIRHKPIHEGDVSVIQHTNGMVVEDPYEELSAGLVVSTRDVIEKGVEAFYEAATPMIEEMVSKQAKLMFDRIDESTRRSGNIIDGKNRELAETFLEAVEALQIEFDNDGKPEFQLVVNPIMEERMQQLLNDRSTKTKYEQILEKKREEWRDRENNRKLVD
jgi:hypothetical protein